jgi:hypothetical protein
VDKERAAGKNAVTDRQRVDEGVPAQLAEHQRLLLDAFATWIDTAPTSDEIAAAAGNIMQRVADDVLCELLVVAGRMPAGDATAWVRHQFVTILGRFGLLLRAHIPRDSQHQASQILQLRMLEAERRVGEKLQALWRTDE